MRSFLTLSLKDAIERIEGYFERQAIGFNGEKHTFSVFTLLDAASPQVRNEKTSGMEADRNRLPPTFADALIEHILTPRALPATLLDAALRRCRVERVVPPARAALLKLYLRSSTQSSDTTMATEHLNEDHPNPAYHCGRLLAVADSIYHAAMRSDSEQGRSGKADMGYVSKRYYSSASTAPASVYGRIIPNVRHQLNVLQRKKPKYAVKLDKLMTQIIGRISDSFPKTLPAVDQAVFALGFYHQREHLMTKKKRVPSPEAQGQARSPLTS